MNKIYSTRQALISPSELVLNQDGSIYHLRLHPEQISDKIIVVGDPDRVTRISRKFDRIEYSVENREFVTHTGFVGPARITALSTGIGVDNVDIVMNELDALRHINLQSREPKPGSNPLSIVRLGTSGALNAQLDPGSVVHSQFAVGLDGVMHYYKTEYDEDEQKLVEQFMAHTGWSISGIRPYAVKSDQGLGVLFSDFHQGITVTASGFYGPQGRVLRLPVAMASLNQRMSNFSFEGVPIANYEMESSALFGLGAMMGHSCTTVCVIVANRLRNAFLTDHHTAIDTLIDTVLEKLSGH